MWVETFTGLRMRQFERLLTVVRERVGMGPAGRPAVSRSVTGRSVLPRPVTAAGRGSGQREHPRIRARAGNAFARLKHYTIPPRPAARQWPPARGPDCGPPAQPRPPRMTTTCQQPSTGCLTTVLGPVRPMTRMRSSLMDGGSCGGPTAQDVVDVMTSWGYGQLHGVSRFQHDLARNPGCSRLRWEKDRPDTAASEPTRSGSLDLHVYESPRSMR